MLKWPTCPSDDRAVLIARIAELYGAANRTDEFQVDEWAFVSWAREQGLDVASRPEPPQLE